MKYEKGKTIGRNQQKKVELIFKNATNIKYYSLNNNFSGESHSDAFDAALYMWQKWSDLKFAKLIEYANNNYDLYLHRNAWFKFEAVIN